ncbi:MAG: formate dehydrogenase subunit delta [Hydrogenobacter sp.]|uniref:formate dehydrogenase subunit delta n=1 Tax=Hydrogenobacter thermophilus TaxID=940 RepID=UPI0030F74411
MSVKDLIFMANQIGNFFEHYPFEEGVEGVVNHIKKFWHPIMREELLRYCEENGDHELIPVVRAALERLKAEYYEEKL